MIKIGQEYKAPLTLEQHLENLCRDSSSKNSLSAIWKISKQIYERALDTISYNFPHYSLHESSHAQNILRAIELVLGEDRICSLGPTDTWLILEAVYCHDFGMIISEKEAKELWQKPEFKAFIEKVSTQNTDVGKAACFLKNTENKDLMELALDIRYHVIILLADYVRSMHPERAERKITNHEVGLDFSACGLVLPRFNKLLGKICKLHGSEFKEIEVLLPHEDGGADRDKIHPRFIACLLRLGDLLDLDNGRFDLFQQKAFSEKLPENSKVHFDKHEGVEHFLITPSFIRVSVDCPSDESYREMRKWSDWLEKEVVDLTLNWNSIIPANFDGTAPRIETEVRLKGNKNETYLANLRFELDPDKTFELLQGAGIYKSKLDFMREFIQNAVDATKLKLWRDIKKGDYRHLFEGDIHSITPLDFFRKECDENFWKRYEIMIFIEAPNFETLLDSYEEFEVTFRIKDRGIGISSKDLIKITQTASSWSKEQSSDIPNWLKPTAAFGVGLQSAFMVTEDFECYTKTDGESKAKKIKFSSRAKGGYVSIAELADQEITTGTEFNIRFKFNNTMASGPGAPGGYAFRNLRKRDSFKEFAISPEIFFLLESIYKCCENLLFPISIFLNGQDTASGINSFFLKESVEFSQWNYDEQNGCHRLISSNQGIPVGLKIFDHSEAIFLNIQFPTNRPDTQFDLYEYHPACKMKFKGMPINRFGQPRKFALYCDILGCDSKENLSLNRSSIREDKVRIFQNRLNEITTNGLEYFFNEIKKIPLIDIEKSNLNFLTMWGYYKKEKNEPFFDNLFQNFQISVQKLGDSEIMERSLSELLKKQKIAFVDMTFRPDIQHRYREEISKSSKKSINGIEEIVVDENFCNWARNNYTSDYLENLGNIKVAIMNWNENDNSGIEIEVETWKKLLDTSKVTVQRSLLPPNRLYPSLHVLKFPIEFRINHIQRFPAHIISPLTRNDIDEIGKLELTKIEEYKNKIMNRKDFKTLIQWTKCFNANSENATEEKIAEEYGHLIDEIISVYLKS